MQASFVAMRRVRAASNAVTSCMLIIAVCRHRIMHRCCCGFACGYAWCEATDAAAVHHHVAGRKLQTQFTCEHDVLARLACFLVRFVLALFHSNLASPI